MMTEDDASNLSGFVQTQANCEHRPTPTLPPMDRIHVLSRHLLTTSRSDLDDAFQKRLLRRESTSGTASMQTEEFLASSFQLIQTLENRSNMELAELIPGPLDDMTEEQVQREIQLAFLSGANMLLAERWCKRYNSKNIVFPMTISPKGAMPYRDLLVTISDPRDVQTVLRNHVKKSDIYGIAFLGDGVLATKDNQLWTEQRHHLQSAFLPSVLAEQVFPKSLARAKFAARTKLSELIGSSSKTMEMSEFNLHEAMAHLQMALLGESEETMEKLNKNLRLAHVDSLSVSGTESLQDRLVRSKQARTVIQAHARQVLSEKPQGPLAQRLVDNCPMGLTGKALERVQRDSTSTFEFAGYDTTGLNMTWCQYELAKNPQHQTRVRAEVDALYNELELEKRDMNYGDLQKLPFMSRVITETLRLWPSVPNGTFREIESGGVQITGRDGKLITLPAGTQCNIPVWLLHSAEDLWGPTVEQFNPDRDFLPEEVWNGVALAGWNPQSYRYMPFTSAPRDCMGKNFAHLEVRVILCELLRHYEFSLAEPTLSASKTDRVRDKRFLAFNAGTMSPRNGIFLNVKKRSVGA